MHLPPRLEQALRALARHCLGVALPWGTLHGETLMSLVPALLSSESWLNPHHRRQAPLFVAALHLAYKELERGPKPSSQPVYEET